MLSSRFLISGSLTGSLDVIYLWKELTPNYGEELEASSVAVRSGHQPPLPNARSSSASMGPATIIRGLSRYHPTNQFLCMFAVGWIDGRICICNVAKISTDVSSRIPASRRLALPVNLSWEWSVLQTFHTQFSFFRLDYTRFKAFGRSPSESHSSPRATAITVDDLSNSEHFGPDLDTNWQSVHGEVEEEEVNYQEAQEEGYILAFSHTGHTVFINLLSTDFGEGGGNSTDGSQLRRLYSFDSRHSLHNGIVRYIAIARLSHITDSDSSSVEGLSSEPPPRPSLSLVYLTGRGDIWIVNNIEQELSLLGPPSIPSIRFTTAELEKANRLVRVWNIIRPLPPPQPPLGEPHQQLLSTDAEIHLGDHSDQLTGEGECTHPPVHQDGTALIRRLLSMSVKDLRQIAQSTSLKP
jgi:hypothetical protein